MGKKYHHAIPHIPSNQTKGGVGGGVPLDSHDLRGLICAARHPFVKKPGCFFFSLLLSPQLLGVSCRGIFFLEKTISFQKPPIFVGGSVTRVWGGTQQVFDTVDGSWKRLGIGC